MHILIPLECQSGIRIPCQHC